MQPVLLAGQLELEEVTRVDFQEALAFIGEGVKTLVELFLYFCVLNLLGSVCHKHSPTECRLGVSRSGHSPYASPTYSDGTHD